jgi:succinoglycan biosynthesis transport protein ExoP
MGFGEDIAKRGGAVVATSSNVLEPISFQYIFSVLWRRRRLILASTAGTLMVAVVYLVLAPTKYTATTTLVLDAKRPVVAQSEVFVEPQVDDTAVESHVETIKSQSVASVVVKKLRLSEDPEFVGVATALKRSLVLTPSDETAVSDEEALQSALAVFAGGLRVTRIPRSYVVEISYISLDPKKAAVIANATAEAYIEDQLQAKFEVTKRASSWLQQRIVELRTQATDAFKSIQDFKSQNNLIVGSDGRLSTDLEIEQLTGSLAKARADTTQAHSRLSQIEAMLAGPAGELGVPDGTVTDALSNPVITKLRQQYLDTKNKEAEWSARYGQHHQAVMNLRTEAVNLRRAIREEMQRIAETYKSDLKVARSREESTEKKLTEVFQNNNSNRQAQVKLRELETAANTYRSIYENFLNRYTQAVQQQSFPSTEARVITFASTGKKTSPKGILTLALALVGGLGLGTAIAFIREQMDRVVYSRDQIVRELGVYCICVVPDITTPEAPGPARLPTLRTISSKWASFRKRSSEAESDEASVPCLIYDDDDLFSMVAEAIRSIKVAMDIRNISHETRVLGIVSCASGEGKSSLALSLAAMIARAGRRALLMDCDLRRPALSALLMPESERSLLDVLYGETALADIARPIEGYSFDFLPGPTQMRPVHTADILNSEPMARLLAAAKHEYDYVIVDLPPILPVIDVRACAHLFDSFLLVAKWGETNVDGLAMALEIAPLHQRLLGAVINKVDVNTMRRIEGYGYSDSSYYG